MPVILFLLACSVASATEEKLSVKERIQMDHALKDSTDKLCTNLGGFCDTYKTTCIDMLFKNSCFQRLIAFEFMGIEFCTESKLEACEREQREYYAKLDAFIRDYASKQVAANAAFRSCMPFHEIKPKTKHVTEMLDSVSKIQGELAAKYFDAKKMYECIEREYKSIIRLSQPK